MTSNVVGGDSDFKKNISLVYDDIIWSKTIIMVHCIQRRIMPPLYSLTHIYVNLSRNIYATQINLNLRDTVN